MAVSHLYGEGNGTPLQYSCLENPRDGGAWWAADYGVAQSRTRLKWLSSSSSSSSHLYVFLFQVFWLFFDWVIYYFDTQLYELSSGHVWMWELDCEESWVLKNWCFWIVLEKTLASPLDSRRSNQSILKETSPGCSLTGTDAEAETPILWPPHGKSWLIGKNSDAGTVWGQEEKGTTEDEMAGWHHQLDGHEFEWTPGVGDGQGGLACCDSWGCKESDMTEWLNWTELYELFTYMLLTSHCPSVGN